MSFSLFFQACARDLPPQHGGQTEKTLYVIKHPILSLARASQGLWTDPIECMSEGFHQHVCVPYNGQSDEGDITWARCCKLKGNSMRFARCRAPGCSRATGHAMCAHMSGGGQGRREALLERFPPGPATEVVGGSGTQPKRLGAATVCFHYVSHV